MEQEIHGGEDQMGIGEPVTGASDWTMGSALLLACFGGLDGGGEGNRDVLILARGLENNKERREMAWI